MSAVASWRLSMRLSVARRRRDDDVGKVAWRYQRFGHQLVGAQAVYAFLDKVKCLYLSPAMTKWKERSFYHVVPPHRYSYQSFGRQMVAAQQVANILDRARILGLIWALSTWNEVVFIKNSGAGNTLIVSPNRFVTGSNWGQPSAKADVSGGLGGAGSPVPPGGADENFDASNYKLFDN